MPEGTRGLFTTLFTKDLRLFPEDSAFFTKDPTRILGTFAEFMQVYMQLTLSKCEFLLWSRVLSAVGLYFFFKILFIYLTEIETDSERGNTSRGSGRGRSRLIAEEPDVGLDPIMPGSRPEPKADA